MEKDKSTRRQNMANNVRGSANAACLNDESRGASADVYLSLLQMFRLQSQPVPLKEFTA